MNDRPGYSFGSEPPPEVSAYLAGKTDLPSFSFRDVEPEEHAVAFAVAKAMSLDVLADIREEVQRALDDGLTFAEFRGRLRPRLEARGWWGRRTMTDPLTGDEREVQLGSPRRLRTIYEANMRSARAAGQWQRMSAARRALPYLLYLLGPSERHRPHHQSKEGWILPIDDPFWDHWMPPNGWGCKCHVRQISAEEAERRGGVTARPEPVDREVLNRRTGEIRTIPVGIDPAWAGNPGRERQVNVERFFADAIAAAPMPVARAAVADVTASWAFRRMFRGDRGVRRMPIGRLGDDMHGALGSASPVVTVAQSVALKGLKHGLGANDYRRVQEAVERGAVRRYPEGELAVLLPDGDAIPLLLILSRKEGVPEGFVSTMFRPARAGYVRNVMDRTEQVRGSAEFDAWLARTATD